MKESDGTTRRMLKIWRNPIRNNSPTLISKLESTLSPLAHSWSYWMVTFRNKHSIGHNQNLAKKCHIFVTYESRSTIFIIESTSSSFVLFFFVSFRYIFFGLCANEEYVCTYVLNYVLLYKNHTRSFYRKNFAPCQCSIVFKTFIREKNPYQYLN
jgi:hypothetical protein